MTPDSELRVPMTFPTGPCVAGPQITGSAESPEKRRYMTPTKAAITATAAAATRNNVGSPVYGPPLAVIQLGEDRERARVHGHGAHDAAVGRDAGERGGLTRAHR